MISRAEVKQAVQRGFVRPSLLYQIDHRVTEKDKIPQALLAEDAAFAEYCRSVHYSIVDGLRR